MIDCVVDRVVMCLMCGDDYKVDVPLSPLLNHQFHHINRSEDVVMSVAVETYLDEFKRKVEVTTASYHSAASQLKDFLYHGYLLVFSARRKASLASLRYCMSCSRKASLASLRYCMSCSRNGHVCLIQTASMLTC